MNTVGRTCAGWVMPLALVSGSCQDAVTDGRVLVFAAASTADAIQDVAATFTAAPILISFGSSSSLARQLGDAAPADIYISASRTWIEELQRTGTLTSPARVVAHNRLVCIVPSGAPLLRDRPTNADSLVDRLAPGDRVAIADAGVPAGEYARQGLATGGGLDRLRPHLVGQTDVRAVVRAVATGQAVAGFAYATDTRTPGVEELFAFDGSSHEPIEYLAAATASATDPELAMAFLEHLTSPTAQRILGAAGFDVVPR